MRKYPSSLFAIVVIVTCLTVLLFSVEATSNFVAANYAQRKTVTFEKLKNNFNDPDMIYAPFAFWFWDAPLDVNLASSMAEQMSAQRMNPGYAHPRKGLPHNQWLSGLWFEAFGAALQQAEAANAYLGYCDEYWWPSGRADGRVLRSHTELAAASLEWEVFTVTGGEEIELPGSFFTVAAKYADPAKNSTGPWEMKILSSTLGVIGSGPAFTWKSPEGKWRIYSFSKYHHAGIDGGDVNYIDRRLPKAFIDIAHEPYVKHFPKQMGKSISGVFVDNEGDYGYKLAWSGDLEKEYKQLKGRDIRRWMPLLIDEDAEGLWVRARWDWYDVVSHIYTDSFLGSVSRWLESYGMYDVSNLWEETLASQAFAVGDFFRAQRAVTMPGTDCLLKKALKVHDFKETHSVTEFEATRFQTEILGVAGWQMSPILMKKAANAVIAWGVSHFVPHGVNLNRNLKTIPYPPDWFTCNPYWRYLHLWTDFARRASYVNSHGHTVPDVLLVNPMDSVWALLGDRIFYRPIRVGRGNITRIAKHGKTIEKIDNIYSRTINDLTDGGVEFLIADRHYLRQMDVTKKGTLSRKPFRFKVVVMPPTVVMPLDVAEKILEFAEAGGRVILLGEQARGSTDNGLPDPEMKRIVNKLKALDTTIKSPNSISNFLNGNVPSLCAQVTFEKGRFQMRRLHRCINGRDFFWLVNNTGESQKAVLKVKGALGRASIWDCENGKITNVPSENSASGSRISVNFEPYQAYWLVFEADTPPLPPGKTGTCQWDRMKTLDGPWQIRIDKSVQPPLAAPQIIAPTELLEEDGACRELDSWLEWGLDKFSGFVEYHKSFELDDSRSQIRLDLGDVKHTVEVWVNDQPIGYRLWPPFRFDISDAVKKGENHLHIRVGNLLCNAMRQYAANESDSIWGWKAPEADDFDAGLFGPVIIKSKRNQK